MPVRWLCPCQWVKRPKGHSSEAYLVFSTTSQILHITTCAQCHGRSHLSLICNVCIVCRCKSKSYSTIHIFLLYWFQFCLSAPVRMTCKVVWIFTKGNLIKAYQEKLWKHTKESVGCCQSTKAAQLTSLPNNQAFCEPDWGNTGNCAGRTCATACVVVWWCACCWFVWNCLRLSHSELINFVSDVSIKMLKEKLK